MIYGKLTSTDDWRTVRVQGDAPDSFYGDNEVRIFLWGTICNRDILQTGTQDCGVTDAALVARLFKVGGMEAFSELDGSFTIVDFSPDLCGITRDAHGTHWPVYYRADGTFSTGWQALKKQDITNLDRCSLSVALQRGLMLPGRSAWQGISRLEAGYSLVLSAANLSVRNVYRIDFSISPLYSERSVDDYAAEYGRLHEAAIRRRVGKADRVGILLSGGYDSGSNLVSLRQVYTGRVDSYSIGFRGNSWSELPVARVMSREFGTCHHEYEIDGSEIRFVPDIVRWLGEPFVEGGLMVNYCAMWLAGADKLPVILGGEGSDQLFGTSGREVALRYLASRWKVYPFLRILNACLSGTFTDTGGQLSRIHFHLDKILHLLEGDRFGFTDTAMRQLLQRPDLDLVSQPSPVPDVSSFEALYNQHARLSDLDIVADRIILYKASRMALMFDNRLTFPFTDRSLYVFLQHLPVSLKCRFNSLWNIACGHQVSKYLLKYRYKPLLPQAVTSRRKQGGFAPMSLFFADSARRIRLKDFILSSSIMDDYLCRKAVQAFLKRYEAASGDSVAWFWYRQNQALQYFNLLTLVVWWEEFVADKRVKLD